MKTNHDFATKFKQAIEAKVSTLPFTNREEYLAWVKNWKQTYQFLSWNIRLHRLECRMTPNMREDKKVRMQKEIDSLKQKTGGIPCYGYALDMLIDRHASKIQSGIQREMQFKAKQKTEISQS